MSKQPYEQAYQRRKAKNERNKSAQKKLIPGVINSLPAKKGIFFLIIAGYALSKRKNLLNY